MLEMSLRFKFNEDRESLIDGLVWFAGKLTHFASPIYFVE
jgi:hypothetical protein